MLSALLAILMTVTLNTAQAEEERIARVEHPKDCTWFYATGRGHDIAICSKAKINRQRHQGHNLWKIRLYTRDTDDRHGNICREQEFDDPNQADVNSFSVYAYTRKGRHLRTVYHDGNFFLNHCNNVQRFGGLPVNAARIRIRFEFEAHLAHDFNRTRVLWFGATNA